MRIYTTGRESSLLEDVRSGRKTIDVRLAKPRFRTFRLGDHMRIREDVWEGGKIVASRPTDIEVEITKIEFFPSFIKMLETVGTERVSPKSGIPEEAISEYRRFYTEEDEKKFGVIAFHFSLL